ncbi:unnamed protein product [Ophioblennius macclurei]
MENVGLEGK